VADREERTERGDDRREFDRSRIIVDVFFDGNDATGVASTMDISIGGFYMSTKAEIPEGSLLLVRIPFGTNQVVGNAEVVYSNPGKGVGVRFQGLSDEARELLARELKNA
jgi:PilZ domain